MESLRKIQIKLIAKATAKKNINNTFLIDFCPNPVWFCYPFFVLIIILLQPFFDLNCLLNTVHPLAKLQ